MKALFVSRIGLAWAGLLIATLVSWELGHGIGIPSVRHASIAIILVSFVEVRFVVREFMELRHAPMALKLLADGWILVVCTVMIGLYAAA